MIGGENPARGESLKAWTNTLPRENTLWVFGTKGSIVRRAVLNVLKNPFRIFSSLSYSEFCCTPERGQKYEQFICSSRIR
jgi:hypothetical protein